MQAITTFIIDDEFQSRNFLHNMLQQCFPELKIVGDASSIKEGLQGINEYKPNIVFLDIQLIEGTGFDLLSHIPRIDFALIFVTAYDQYAIKAFRFNAIDYLLKPIVREELIEAVNKVKQKIVSAKTDTKKLVDQLYLDILNPKKVHDKIAISTLDGFIIVPVNEIIYCHANSNYTRFYLTDRKSILSSYTLKQYDEMLSNQSFFRAHRSYLINLVHVKFYKKGEGGEIVMSNGDEIELSRTHKAEFLHLLNIR